MTEAWQRKESWDVPDVRIRVVSKKGFCVAGHRVGDEWVCKGQWAPVDKNICLTGLNACFARIHALKYGVRYPWRDDPDTAIVECPDATNCVVFELRRLPSHTTIHHPRDAGPQPKF